MICSQYPERLAEQAYVTMLLGQETDSLDLLLDASRLVAGLKQAPQWHLDLVQSIATSYTKLGLFGEASRILDTHGLTLKKRDAKRLDKNQE